MSNMYRRGKAPMAPVPEDPKAIYTVLKITRPTENADPNQVRVSVRGIHDSECQAYTAALLDLVHHLETVEDEILPKIRTIAKSETLDVKDRLKSIMGCQSSETEERVQYVVQRSQHFPEDHDMDIKKLLDGPILSAYWESSDDEEYDPDEDDEDDEDYEDSDDEDEDMELVDEGEYFAGIGSSGAKDDDEGDENVAPKISPATTAEQSQEKEHAPKSPAS